MSKEDDFELDEFDEFDKFDDADDDELFERESKAEDFEERMARETEDFLNDTDIDDRYFDGYDSEDDLDE